MRRLQYIKIARPAGVKYHPDHRRRLHFFFTAGAYTEWEKEGFLTGHFHYGMIEIQGRKTMLYMDLQPHDYGGAE